MKRFVLWSLAAGVPFGLVMGLFFFLVTETAGAALLAGALAGTLFGAGLGGAVVVLTASGQERFVVEERSRWIERDV